MASAGKCEASLNHEPSKATLDIVGLVIEEFNHEQWTRHRRQRNRQLGELLHPRTGTTPSGAPTARHPLLCLHGDSLGFPTGLDHPSLGLPRRRTLEAQELMEAQELKASATAKLRGALASLVIFSHQP